MSEFVNKDEVIGKVQDAKSLSYLLRFTKNNRKEYIISIFMLVVSSILTITTAWLIGQLVQKGLVEKNLINAIGFATLVFVFELVSILLIWKGREILADAATNSILLIRKKLFSHIHALPISYYDREPQGRTITRMTHDVEGIENFLTGSIGRMATGIFTFVVALVAMLLTDMKLGILLSLSMLPSLFILFGTRRYNRDLNRRSSKASSLCNAKLSEFINSLPVIRAFGLENWSYQKYQEIILHYRDCFYANNRFFSLTRPLILFLCELPMVLLFYFGGVAIIKGELSVGVFVAFMGYCNRFSGPLMMLSREISVIQQAFTSAERVTTFLQAKTEKDLLGVNGSLKPKEFKGKIDFKAVDMSYDGKKSVLRKVSFNISAGEKVGLVGRTGSGKTTTVSLLSRLYEFQSGEILIDDIPLRSIERNYLRDNIGFVSQDVIIFKGTLAENLICERNVSLEAVEKACELTGLKKVMLKNNLSLDSMILDLGANLSAGEKQLVSLTRVLLKNPGILILDEATANIDPFYEKLIHDAVDKIMLGRTCLIIAHRLSTLESCDRIFVFDKGELVEQGDHHELLSLNGHFRSLQKNSEVTIRV
ncbi:MAG: ABC transporter ATP-binding protein [Bacteriovoracaceae bacterium]|jgi:ABC-type multidrug transport system fused ATPase/permease subunit|nr:ABC transporter ATP-binding protein [Bacteriovoracaceae bacterium]